MILVKGRADCITKPPLLYKQINSKTQVNDRSKEHQSQWNETKEDDARKI